jgi:uncharacterized repeat protein (TIGR01451 family)
VSATDRDKNIRYTLGYNNIGKSFATGVSIIEKIPTNTCFTVGSIYGLSGDYTLEYSNNGGASYSYSPVGST